MNKKDNVLFKDVKEFNKYLLLTIGISIIALSGTISYFINGSYAAWNSTMYSDDVFNLSVSVPTGIVISNAPTKVEYKEGEIFDLTGIIVQQVYSSGRKVVIEDFEVSPSGELTTNNTVITISYNGFTTTQNITVKKAGMDALTFAQIKVGTDGLEQVTHAADSTLQINQAVTEYRYRGASSSVNNYVYFNCSDLNNQNASTCETWKIIGVMPTDDGTGKIENRIKIIKPTSLGNMDWDESNSNNWARPSTLNTYLNNDYYNTLSIDAKSMVGPTKYYLGGSDNDPKFGVEVMWRYERKTSDSTYYYGNNPTNYTDEIAIMYASDYGYAASSACSDSTNLYYYDSSTCKDNNWLYLGENEWLLPQYADYSSYTFHVRSWGDVYNYGNDAGYIQFAVRPVLSLSANVTIIGGTGVPEDAYQLGL